MAIEFEVSAEFHIDEVMTAAGAQVQKGLEMCGLAAEGYAKLLCPVDNGTLRNSITHTVVGEDCYIGTNMEYGPYVELGTGIHYEGGRRTSWVYQDSEGNWHMTDGQRPQPFIKPAVADHVGEYKSILENALKG